MNEKQKETAEYLIQEFTSWAQHKFVVEHQPRLSMSLLTAVSLLKELKSEADWQKVEAAAVRNAPLGELE